MYIHFVYPSMNLMRFMDISIFWDEVSAWQYARLLEDACVLLKIASRSLHVERRTNNLNFSITSLIDLSYCLFYLVRTVGHCNYSPNTAPTLVDCCIVFVFVVCFANPEFCKSLVSPGEFVCKSLRDRWELALPSLGCFSFVCLLQER